MKFSLGKQLFFIGVFATILISCEASNLTDKVATSERVSPIYEGPNETPYCSENFVYNNSIKIRGRAQYRPRLSFGDETTGGLGSQSSAKPIRRAEVRIINLKGTVVQCGETKENGRFTIELPQGDAEYLLFINSRANNAYLNASVLNAPERNQFYSMSLKISALQNQNIGNLVALASGNVLSGAFNILDQILLANDYLRAQVGNCNFSNCPDFSTTPKVSVYWEKGFNPGSYFGSSTLSFYLPSYQRLFVLGGVDGDIDFTDTDHFDNSVIIHEYGHFIEDMFFTSDSPGGEHTGTEVIDPRLAWSEGFANFFQSAVLGGSYYWDTQGNSTGSTDFIIYRDLEDVTQNNPSDNPQFSGEGEFREFSITRLLYDAIDTGGIADEAITNGFDQIWNSIANKNGLDKSNLAFRSIGFFHLFQNSFGSDWSTLRTLEKHSNDRSEYANYLKDTDSCSMNFNITPYNDPNDDGLTLSTSHLLRNNDFFHINHKGGKLNLKLNYTTTIGTEADLELYLYNESAGFGFITDILGASEDSPDGIINDTESETINISNLVAGDYLINVNVVTIGAYATAGSTNYELTLKGDNLCPSNLP